ncbi:MAG: HD domain-containing protein, partial [Thermodesulfobacteriota bacterium]|nr:HD domain-containing protein [Thermodesulfobacteriota bacterium]
MKRFLKKLGANSRFRDPIYGYIWLTDKEKKIIDLPLFQRLRRVHQLALTKYVYPTAEHSRFVHSLGAVHCATAMFAGIFQHNDTHTRLLTESEQDRFLGLLRFAALLHDIGHLPFSHGAEKELLGDLGHEDISQYLITKYGPLQSILEDDAQIVSSILSSSTMRQKYKILHEIISGHLDADRADYLMRDSYICGVKYGEYDFERYMQSFGAFKENSSLRLFVNERDIFVVEAFLMARYHYNLQVPYHRTRTGYDLILRRYFRDLQERRLYEEFFKKDETGKIAELDTNFYEDFDDYAVFEQIKKDYRAGNKWAEMLLRQGHLLP